MIYTLTLSPSIDYFIEGQDFQLSGVSRFENSQLLPGGKGINASIVLSRLGFQNQAITCFDQNSFNLVVPLLSQEKNVEIYNIATEQRTRINIKYYANNASFEINGPRTVLNQQELAKLDAVIAKLKADDLIFIMGISSQEIIYAIIEKLKKQHVNFVLDIDSLELKNFLQYQPLLIKPNQDELERLFGIKINDEKDILQALETIQKLGAKNIIISFDARGSYLLDQNGAIYKAKIIKPLDKVVSATGAGDTLISTFIIFQRSLQDSQKAFHYASAAAMATVSEKWLATKAKFEKYLNHIKIIKIK
ncbi:PfkB family carbohydrate kinase [Mycoplasma iguanae]|uniref:PfkB family carbohydrate kinase n=1 Tax=Mycoplasma iguanae TaxID=292461 RepID=A0ABY5R9T2_9MOLU|nr:PfkB family carbohydrate kinase [Mycoplasma iguanae]UVD81532.1 PfkB family carbohydrate kinase [Mycoplasma iguanae]